MSKNHKPKKKVRPGWAGSGDHITNAGMAKRMAEEKLARASIKVDTTSAAHIRAKTLKHKHIDPPPPKPKYDIFQVVDVPEAYVSEKTMALIVAGMTVGMVICGMEWGGANKRTLPGDDVWYYRLRDFKSKFLGDLIIAEKEILGVLGDERQWAD